MVVLWNLVTVVYRITYLITITWSTTDTQVATSLPFWYIHGKFRQMSLWKSDWQNRSIHRIRSPSILYKRFVVMFVVFGNCTIRHFGGLDGVPVNMLTCVVVTIYHIAVFQQLHFTNIRQWTKCLYPVIPCCIQQYGRYYSHNIYFVTMDTFIDLPNINTIIHIVLCIVLWTL